MSYKTNTMVRTVYYIWICLIQSSIAYYYYSFIVVQETKKESSNKICMSNIDHLSIYTIHIILPSSSDFNLFVPQCSLPFRIINFPLFML